MIQAFALVFLANDLYLIVSKKVKSFLTALFYGEILFIIKLFLELIFLNKSLIFKVFFLKKKFEIIQINLF